MAVLEPLPPVLRTCDELPFSLRAQRLLQERACAESWYVDGDPQLTPYLDAIVKLQKSRYGNFVATQLWMLASPNQRRGMLTAVLEAAPTLALHPLGCRLIIAMVASAEGPQVLERLLQAWPLKKLLPSEFGQYVLRACVLWHADHAAVRDVMSWALESASNTKNWRRLVVDAIERGRVSRETLAAAAGDAAMLKALLAVAGKDGNAIRAALHRVVTAGKPAGALQAELQEAMRRFPAAQPPSPPPAAGLALQPCMLIDEHGRWSLGYWGCVSISLPDYSSALPLVQTAVSTLLEWRFDEQEMKEFGVNRRLIPAAALDADGRRYRLCLHEAMLNAARLPYRRRSLEPGDAKDVAVIAQLRCDEGGEVEITFGGRRWHHSFHRQPNAMFRLIMPFKDAGFTVELRNL